MLRRIEVLAQRLDSLNPKLGEGVCELLSKSIIRLFDRLLLLCLCGNVRSSQLKVVEHSHHVLEHRCEGSVLGVGKINGRAPPEVLKVSGQADVSVLELRSRGLLEDVASNQIVKSRRASLSLGKFLLQNLNLALQELGRIKSKPRKRILHRLLRLLSRRLLLGRLGRSLLSLLLVCLVGHAERRERLDLEGGAEEGGADGGEGLGACRPEGRGVEAEG
mmetsp:Transcript_28581/g.55757  ORF Transcript_28581/g.55757 Transcript_28581/m.55757 type:complete len:219 (-) Transcript_28581:160-816(-)